MSAARAMPCGAWIVLGVCLLVPACGGAGPEDRAAHEAFLRGNASFGRSEVYEAEWRRAGGDPRAFEAALMQAEDALRFWQTAAASRSDWPAARRNVERALLRIDGLRERKQGGGQGKPRPVPGQPRPPGDPQGDPAQPPAQPPPDRPGTNDPAARAETKLQSGDLPAGQVFGLFERLRAKDQEKQRLRQAQRRARAAEVERDW